MATKYDTNPLDPDFPEKARAAAAEGQPTNALPFQGPETQHFGTPAPTEEQTRRFVPADGSPFSTSYSSQFSAGNYQPVSFANADQSVSRKVDKLGLPENVLTALPYIPWYIGMVAGLLILFLVPKSEAKVRFHAAQGLAAHIGILIVTTMLSLIGQITGVARVGNVIFQIVTTILLIVFAIKAWKGKPVHIESVDPLTNWLDEKVQTK